MYIRRLVFLLIPMLLGCGSSEKTPAPETPPPAAAAPAEAEASTSATPSATTATIPTESDPEDKVGLGDDENPTSESPNKEAPAAPTLNAELDWGYAASNGPATWGSIKADYALCQSGKMQSPINLVWSKPLNSASKMEFDYQDVPLHVVDAGHTIKVKFPAGSFAYFGDKRFELVDLQFRTSSEHQLSGNQMPLEAQLTHKNELGQMAVVALFLIEGQFNPFIEKIWAHLPDKKFGERLVPSLLMNAKDLLPDAKTHYFYTGSLTTPPCTEGVKWYVFNTPLQVSREQIVAFRKVYSQNARPVQPLNQRRVVNF